MTDNIYHNTFNETIYKRENGDMGFYAPVATNDKTGFKAVYRITGKTMFAVSPYTRKIEYTYSFYSVDYDDIPNDFMVKYLEDMYGANLVPPLPIGAIENCKIERIE